MTTPDDFKKALDLIKNSNNILITTHTRPDGDACASVLAMQHALTGLGKSVTTLFLSEIPDWYRFLFDESPTILAKDITLAQLKQTHPDLIIILDTNSYSQLPQFDEYLRQSQSPVLVIDHHLTADGLGDVELIDTTAAAAGLIVCDFLKYAGWKISPKIAHALFVAVATDTGWFQFANTDTRVFLACAELIDAGADPIEIYHHLYQNFSIQRFRLMLAMLNTLELHFDGRYAVQHLTLGHFKQTGAAFKDTENLIDECRRIGTIQAAAFFVEHKDGQIRCSLRSTGRIDVRKIAQKFGGGGHKMAAGTFLPGPLENAKKLIYQEIEQQFQTTENNAEQQP